jgi:hypothetical protein
MAHSVVAEILRPVNTHLTHANNWRTAGSLTSIFDCFRESEFYRLV